MEMQTPSLSRRPCLTVAASIVANLEAKQRSNDNLSQVKDATDESGTARLASLQGLPY